jgi:MFS-type transporter involved in bile tolerance (Atg22 family)
VNAVHNEQTKLTATALNNLAVATIIAGFLSPIVALRLDAASPRADDIAVVTSLVWLLLGWILHLVARLVLLRLKE